MHAEMVRRQVSAMAGSWPRVRDWQSRPAGSWRDRVPLRLPFPGRDLASLTRAEWRRIRKSLDRDRPVLLTLLPRSDAYSRSRAAWQVLATGYTRSGRRVKVAVYDPGRPDDDDIRLGFSLGGELGARLDGGWGIRGFFAVPYDRSPAEPLRAETFDDRSVIGLNRMVRGRVAPAAGRGGLDLVARDADGGLVHFRRGRGKSWDGANVTESNELGAYEVHCDPAAVRAGRSLHVFARSHVGDLLHFRRGRTWSVSNRTDHRRAGARFRIQSTPVVAASRRFRLSVLGRDEDGGLIHYDGSPIGRWRAEQVAGETLVEEPLAKWVGETLHVVGLARRGHLIHWQREGDRWTVTDLSEQGGPGAECVGRPALMTHEGAVHVFSRDADGRLLLMTPDAEGLWQLSVLAGNLAGDPVGTVGPAGLHVFAPTEG
ncbi:MAG: hypothetical protein GWN02_05610, partial [Gemmatimonadetes bacterium]|nr:hypothetical protein [Gemmatimonadota bacterium]NIY07777.1 hypothetical protein [Gemmatimonadota bacterium]